MERRQRFRLLCPGALKHVGAAPPAELHGLNGSGANLKGSASGGNGLDDRTGLRTGTLQGSAFRPRDNCPVRAVVPDIQAQLP